MKDIIRNVIERRNYELSDMLKKIDTLWVQGSITEEEREELIALARQNAEVQQSIDILAKLEELDKRMRVIENRFNSDIEDGEGETEGDAGEVVTYPEYEVGKWYYRGDIVVLEGKEYKCIAPERVVCTWSPADYPAYWEEYTEDAPLTE